MKITPNLLHMPQAMGAFGFESMGVFHLNTSGIEISLTPLKWEGIGISLFLLSKLASGLLLFSLTCIQIIFYKNGFIFVGIAYLFIIVGFKFYYESLISKIVGPCRWFWNLGTGFLVTFGDLSFVVLIQLLGFNSIQCLSCFSFESLPPTICIPIWGRVSFFEKKTKNIWFPHYSKGPFDIWESLFFFIAWASRLSLCIDQRSVTYFQFSFSLWSLEI